MASKNSFSQTLKDYKAKHQLTQREMADILSISERMYGSYERGVYDGEPGKVKKYLDRLSGNIPVKDDKKTNNSSKQASQSSGTPVYDIVATASQNENVNQLTESPAYRVSIPGYLDCDFGMYVYGHSMYPTIETGSLVLTRRVTDKHVIMYGEIYLIRTDDYLMVKRLQKSEKKGHVLCTSDNFEQRAPQFKRFEPFDLDIDKIRELYLVKGIIKKTQT